MWDVSECEHLKLLHHSKMIDDRAQWPPLDRSNWKPFVKLLSSLGDTKPSAGTSKRWADIFT